MNREPGDNETAERRTLPGLPAPTETDVEDDPDDDGQLAWYYDPSISPYASAESRQADGDGSVPATAPHWFTRKPLE